MMAILESWTRASLRNVKRQLPAWSVWLGQLPRSCLHTGISSSTLIEFATIAWNERASTPDRRHNIRHYGIIGSVVIVTFDFWLWKTFPAVATHMTNICGQFHWNPSTTYGDVASRGISVNGRTEGRTTRTHNVSTTCCWQIKGKHFYVISEIR